MKKYKCKCCGYYTLKEKPLDPDRFPGTSEICPVCFWEDDSLQYLDPDFAGGANNVSLNVAKKNFKEFGAVEIEMLNYVRCPKKNEQRLKQDKTINVIIAIALFMLLCFAIYRSHQIQYSLLDTIDNTESIEGITVCTTGDKHYSLYSLGSYNVDLNKKSILLTSYDLNKITIGKKNFIKIFVGNKHENVINVYLLSKPNLYFDIKDSIDQYIIDEYR